MYMYACIVHCWGPHGGWAIWLNGLPSGNKDFIIIIIIIQPLVAKYKHALFLLLLSTIISYMSLVGK